jgi:glycyl-tRNA synthetase beta chain
VVSLNPTRFDQLLPRLKALQAFRALPQAEALAAANKRIRNILKQAGGAPATVVDPALLREPAEQQLAREVEALRAQVEALLSAGNYAAALQALASLRPAVDAFFDKVMVMAEDTALRHNRLALLAGLSNLFLGAADISKLQGRQA